MSACLNHYVTKRMHMYKARYQYLAFSQPVSVRSTENCVPVYSRIIVTPDVTVPS